MFLGNCAIDETLVSALEQQRQQVHNLADLLFYERLRLEMLEGFCERFTYQQHVGAYGGQP